MDSCGRKWRSPRPFGSKPGKLPAAPNVGASPENLRGSQRDRKTNVEPGGRSLRDRGIVQRSPEKSHVHGEWNGHGREQSPGLRCGKERAKQVCWSELWGPLPAVGGQRGPHLADRREPEVDGVRQEQEGNEDPE